MVIEALQDFFQSDESERVSGGLQSYEIPRTIVVGLGGTGCIATKWSMRFIREHFDGQLPPTCQFLVIDTTGEEPGAAIDLGVGNFVDIGGFNANQYFQHARKFHFLDWLPAEEYLPGEINMVPYGKPHVGRLCYFMHRDGKVQRAVSSKLKKLTQPTLNASFDGLADEIHVKSQARIHVHLVASVCGGTGAGCLLDAAYDLRRWCEDTSGHPPLIIGHLVLPEAFQLHCSEMIHQQHRTNGFALLCQINHFMGPNETTIRYKRGPEVTWEDKVSPLDICFLLDGASGTTTTTREKICRHVGRMISAMACEKSGKYLWDRLDNVFTDMHARGLDDAALPVYSSYEIATGTRPVRDLMTKFMHNTHRVLGELKIRDAAVAPPPEQPWGAMIAAEVFDKKTSVDEITREFLAAARNLSEDRETAGGELKDAVEEALQHAHPQAKSHIKKLVKDWRAARLESVIDEKLASWSQQDSDVMQLPGFLRSLQEQLQLPRRKGKAHEKLESEIRDLVTTNNLSLLVDTKTKDNIVKHVVDFVEICLVEAWEAEYEELAAHLRRGINDRLTRLDHLARQCRNYHAQSSARRQVDQSDQLYMYRVSQDALDDARFDYRQILKNLVVELLKSDTQTRTDYVGGIREVLAGPGEVHGQIVAALQNFFEEYEKSAGSGHGEQVKTGLQRLWDSAAPRWLPEPHKDVEHISCVTFPSTIPLEKLARELNDDLEPIVDAKYRDTVLVISTQHGAALSDLRHVKLYRQAFEETKRMRQKSSKFKPEHMWLDQRWDNVTLIKDEYMDREPDVAMLTFGLLLQQDRIRFTGRNVVFESIDGQPSLDLGLEMNDALETWSLPENRDLIRDEYSRLPEDLRVLAEMGEAAIERLGRLLSATDQSQTSKLRSVKLALSERVKQWRGHLAARDADDLPRRSARVRPSARQSPRTEAPVADGSPEALIAFALCLQDGTIKENAESVQLAGSDGSPPTELGAHLSEALQSWCQPENEMRARNHYQQLLFHRGSSDLIELAELARADVEKRMTAGEIPESAMWRTMLTALDDQLTQWRPQHVESKKPVVD